MAVEVELEMVFDRLRSLIRRVLIALHWVEEERMSHTLRMLLGCLLPLLLLFVLPLFGRGEGVTLFVAIVLMFICHLLMIGGHHQGHSHGDNRHADQGDRHAHS